MKYKLVAIDLDGTLLDDQKKISPENIAAIQKLQEAGVVVVLASGRAFQGIKKYQPQLDVQGLAISYNGAMVSDIQTGEIFSQDLMESKDAKALVAHGLDWETTMCLWSKHQLYTNVYNDRVAEYETFSNVPAIVLGKPADFDHIMDQGLSKIFWYDDPDRIEDFEETLLGARGLWPQTTICKSGTHFLEFFHQDTSKGLALAQIGKRLDIPAEAMISFGDAANDLSMLTYAGLGVAMGNASPEVKEAADFITLTNEENGVAYALEQFILQASY